MLKVRLQTKFLLSLLLVTIGLTGATLFIVQRTVQKQVQQEVYDDLQGSVLTFRDVQRQREAQLARSAALVADLPILKAVMTSHDSATIQDSSAELWTLTGGSLFVLADRSGKVVALHTSTPGFSIETAQQAMQGSWRSAGRRHWWYGNGHLYEVFVQPVYFGAPADNSLLGVLAVGYEIDTQVAQEVGRIAASRVAFRYGDTVVVSTLSPRAESGLAASLAGSSANSRPEDLQFEGERYLSTSVELSSPGDGPPVRLSVLKSYDQASAYLRRLNRMLLALGLIAVALGSTLMLILSRTFSRPLKSLVAGVRSMESGNFSYPLESRGDDEVAEVTGAFERMRRNLHKTQQQLLESERMATIGTMASFISHDLRHSLTAVIANAEFLSGTGIEKDQREELYQEIRAAVDEMTELIESLLEFSRTQASLNLSYAGLQQVVRRAALAVQIHPQWQRIAVQIDSEAPAAGWFDEKKLQRVFYNLLLNACEAVPAENGRIQVLIRQESGTGVVRIHDNGTGIPDKVRDKLFQPFVSSGKQNGTGMGLAVVQKIVQDHGGEVLVESSSSEGTVFVIRLPLGCHTDEVTTAKIRAISQH
ncbi:MAG TPA: HAMP domain-containing sensor histidine kinase [Terriglobales bacterium]|nr:HAMP domain-containing sensor histidine kinase [Terriglobales bacterium]